MNTKQFCLSFHALAQLFKVIGDALQSQYEESSKR